MELENQVSNLELSKRLKKLGVKQESLFYWVHPFRYRTNLEDLTKWELVYRNDLHAGLRTEFYSSFTVAELGEMFPHDVVMQTNKRIFQIMDGSGTLPGWVGSTISPHMETEADTEVDSRAKMLIYLLENKLTCQK